MFKGRNRKQSSLYSDLFNLRCVCGEGGAVNDKKKKKKKEGWLLLLANVTLHCITRSSVT